MNRPVYEFYPLETMYFKITLFKLYLTFFILLSNMEEGGTYNNMSLRTNLDSVGRTSMFYYLDVKGLVRDSVGPYDVT